MRARSIPVGSMFAWIPSAFRLVMNHIGAMVAANLITIVIWIACYLPLLAWIGKSVMEQGIAGLVTAQQGSTYWVLYGISVLMGLTVLGPVFAGWMRLCESADRGEAVSGTQVLAFLTDGGTWARITLFALMCLALAALFAGLLFLVFGDALRAIVAMQEAQNAAVLGGGRPPPPDMAVLGQVILMYLVLLPALFLMQVLYSVGACEIGLRRASAATAFVDSALGVLRNLVKLLVFLFCLFVLAFVSLVLVGLVIVLLFMLLALLSQVLAAVAAGILYLALLLVMYPLMFAGGYFVWKDMLGGADAADAGAGSVAA